MRIPLARPDLGVLEMEAVLDVLKSSRLSLGPYLTRFEASFCRQIGVPHAVGVSSGTAGLHLCVRAFDWGPGDEVITTPLSFIASSNVLLFENVTPVFVDVDPLNWNLDPKAVGAAINPRTRGILAVHLFGVPAPMASLNHLAESFDLRVLEDACEALGSHIDGRPLGGIGHAGVFGFYANKQITTAEGGMITLRNPELTARVRLLRNQGRDPHGGWFDQVELGYNYRLSELACAMGAIQLQRLESLLRRRREVAESYDALLGRHPLLHLPPRPAPPDGMGWFGYVLRLSDRLGPADRDAILLKMADRGIQCGRYFAPIHLQPYYRKRFGFKPGDFPIAEGIAERCLALPFFGGLTRSEIESVCRCLERALADYA